MELLVGYLALFCPFLVIEEHSVDTGVPQSFILGCTLFHYMSDPADDVICNIDVILIDSSLYWKCDQTFYFWQQLEFAFGLESDQSDTVDWGRKFLLKKCILLHLTSLITLLLLL